jgi:hypothetical protein
MGRIEIIEPLTAPLAPGAAPIQVRVPVRREFHTNRYELKYLVDERRARGIRDFIKCYLQRDRYSQPDLAYAYPIYSLYLDGPGLMLYSATCQGLKNRYKLRVRYYDHNPATPAFFEIKRRVGDAIVKERAGVRKDAVQQLLAGGCPRREDLLDHRDVDDFFVLRRFCELRAAIGAVPRIIVRYEREAWVSRSGELMRTSFDRRVACARYEGSLEPRTWTDGRVPAVILELKFTGRYPVWMRELVLDWDLHRLAMPKYVHCMDQLPRHVNGNPR